MKVVGIGTLCLTSQLLKQMGLKEQSLPFDWIFSSPEMIVHAIRDDFREFLDRSNISEIPVEKRPDPQLYRAENNFYRDEFGVRFIFNHHEPSIKEEDYQYFVRCVNRFREVVRGEKALFLLLKIVRSTPIGMIPPAYGRLSDLLYPHKLLCIEIHLREGVDPSYEVAVHDGNLEVGRLYTKSACSGVSFGCREDFETISNLIRDRMHIGSELPRPLLAYGPDVEAEENQNLIEEVRRFSPKSLDQMTLYRGMITADGWSKAGPPAILYEGELVTVWQAHRVDRPDVAGFYGLPAKDWGFSVRALVGRPPIDQQLVSIVFPDGERIDAPPITRVTASN